MKQIINNKYITSYTFHSCKEVTVFNNNQTIEKKLILNETYGDYYYTYICRHSLTGEKLFLLSFSSETVENELSFLFWDNSFILHTGKSIYLLDENICTKAKFEITTPLIGLFLTNSNKLLILEQTFFWLIDSLGEILKSEICGFIENYYIEVDVLHIINDEGKEIIEII
jgi:hypothetical protein